MKSNESSDIRTKSLDKSANEFPVVGIGASAGGLDAFKKLITAIPPDGGMAFVLVQHLDPKHESLLPEILQKITAIPVVEISDDIIVRPNHIYIIPSNKMLIANDGVLLLSPRSPNKSERHLPIDLFFSSLAEVHQSHSIGVVLSGTASDGTKGLKAIKDYGGITIAQNEESAAYEGMPQSAILAGVVDFILPPEEIPQKLIELTRIIDGDSNVNEIPAQQDSDVFKQILSMLRSRKGTDFTYYKQTTIRRRILRRMAINKNEEPAAYLEYFRKNKTEQDVLYQDLLIPVTSFFRDTKTFENLCNTTFSQLAKNIKTGESLRIWVAGCSTGEEVYSIAICLKEIMGNRLETVQIFATDISEPAIAKARTGIYSKSETAGISDQRLQEFFTKHHDGYQVNKPVRDICVFAVHNFLKDPPFGRMDLISCRNVLIYLEPYLQKKALTTFHYSLNTNGFLLLGKSETIGSVPGLFSTAQKEIKLFSRKNVPAKYMHTASPRIERTFADMNEPGKTEIMKNDFQKAADDIIQLNYSPPGVIVNEAMDIVYFRGSTGIYLEQTSGKPSHNLLKMAKPGLAFELRNILHKAKKENGTVTKENVPLEVNGTLVNISIDAIPLTDTIDAHYLILFHNNNSPGTKSQVIGSKKIIAGKPKTDANSLRIQQLEQELAQIREDMRSITEEQEAANEELQSANEELLSGGEELQSLNEELETGKEELQSANEELTVVNQEMMSLNEQIADARDYSDNIIANLRESLIILDKNQRVITANSSFYKTFQVNELETEGVLIYDLGNKQWNIPALRTFIEKILPKKTQFNDFEVTHTFSHIGERIMLLNARAIKTAKKKDKYILLSIEDITEKKKAQEIMNKSGLHLQYLVKELPAGVYSCDTQGYITFYNNAAAKLWGREPEIGKERWCGSWKIFKADGTPLPSEDCPMALAIREKRAIMGEELIVERPDGTRSDLLVYPQPEFDLAGELTGAINMVFDITELAKANKQIKESEEQFRYLVEQTLSPICIFKGEDMILEVANQPVFKIWNVGNEAMGKPFLEIVPEMKDQPFFKLLKEVFHKGITHHGNEWPAYFIREDGRKEHLYFNFVFQPYRERKGIISGVFVFANDVTEQVIAKNKNLEDQEFRNKELEENVQQRTIELSEANQELQKKNKELEAFNYISSHDLQEPLRKIQTFTNRILAEEHLHLSAKGKDDFFRIQNAAQRMQTLIEDLLAYSRTNITARKVDNIDLNDIIEDTEKELSEIIRDKKATLEIGSLCRANVNPFQFQQVMTNLLVNSLKFSKQGIPPHITIKSKTALGQALQNENSEVVEGRLNHHKNYCHISVNDNGIGFDPKYKDQIFDVFQRLHGKDEYPGTGIGLAIVKKIIENHNGIVTATSEPDKGATFDIYIPN